MLKSKIIIEKWIKIFKSKLPNNNFVQKIVDYFELYELGEPDALKKIESLENEMLNYYAILKVNPKKNMFLSIDVGVGGLDAKDLKNKMQSSFKKISGIELDEELQILKIQNKAIYSKLLMSEAGVQKIIRLSPFTLKRQTSFLKVNVFEDQTEEIKIDEKDIDIEVCKSSSKGGQHANKTESAVRVIYRPFNIAVRIQDQRSQHRNKDIALKKLRERIIEFNKNRQDKIKENAHSISNKPNWGNEFIKIICIYPNKFVKDLRTNTKFVNFNCFNDLDYTKAINKNIKAFLINDDIQ